jgi:hypothetical protein
MVVSLGMQGGYYARMVEKQRRVSHRVPVIVAQQPAQAIPTHDCSTFAASFWCWSNQLIADTLMILFAMIMGQVLADHM